MRPLRPGLLPLIILVVVLLWVVFAVAMLTGTLFTARQINTRVHVINTVLPPINQNLQSLTLANQTVQVAGQIDKVVKPLGPQFTQVTQAVGSINNSVQSVQQRVGAINAAVKSIDASANSINPVVVSIGARLTAVDGDVRSINDSVHGIDNRLQGTLDHVHSINHEAAGINDRAEHVRDIAKDIKSDLDLLDRSVVPDINRNAHAIARSPLVQLKPLQLLAKLPAPALQLPQVANIKGLLSGKATEPTVTGPVGTSGTLPAPPLLTGAVKSQNHGSDQKSKGGSDSGLIPGLLGN